MKKLILSAIFFIGVGFLLGNFFFQHHFVLGKQKDMYYFLEEGVYSNKEMIQNNVKSISQKMIDYDQNYYYVYVGITKDLEVAEKLKEIYQEQGYKIIIKEKMVSSEEFSFNVTQFDLLVKNAKTKEEVLTIEEVVLANYQELFKKQ